MKKLFVLFVLLVSTLNLAQAQGFAVGAQVGYGMAKPNNTDFSGLAYGLNLSYDLMPEFTLGYNMTTFAESNKVGTLDVTSRNWNYVITGDYNLLMVPGLHVGGRLGMNSISSSVSGSSVASDSDFTIGFGAGYDYPVATNITLGAEGNYNIVLNSPSYSVIQFYVPVKFHF
jgi:opacity protein-like surface antigen